jgi:hypothetical protein
MSENVLQSLSNYVVSLTELKFSGRLIICLDFYEGGIRSAVRTLEESLTVSGTTCGKPNPD